MAKKKLGKNACLHCIFLMAAREKWKDRKDKSGARADIIASALKIGQNAFEMMSPEEQTEFIKSLSAPRPDFSKVADAIKAALGGLSFKVTEH